MIQIDIEMPKNCAVCMFSQWSNLSQTASCKLKDYEPCFDDFSKEYKSKRASFCPLHEVTDTDTISRKQTLEHLKKRLYESALNNDGIASKIFEEIADNRVQIWVDELPPSPTVTADSDTISRRQAIDALFEILDRPKHAEFLYTDEIARALNQLPPSTSRPQWIPVSERLPEVTVLCCDTRGEMIIGYLYQDEESNTGYSAVLDDVVMIDCIAWMPLPEPYHRP